MAQRAHRAAKRAAGPPGCVGEAGGCTPYPVATFVNQQLVRVQLQHNLRFCRMPTEELDPSIYWTRETT